jgi:HEAT repeat protein
VRTAAVTGLGVLGGPHARDAVLAAHDDPDPAVRIAAIEAIGLIGVAEDARRIVPGLHDDDWETRKTSAIALSRLGAVGRLQLRRIARSGEGPAVDTARWILDAEGPKNPAAVVAEGA